MDDLPPPMTAAQLAARDRADQDLAQKYPDQYVGYVDTWQGDELTRDVLAAAPDLGAFHELLDKVPRHQNRRVRVSFVPAPSDSICVWSSWIDSPP